MSIYMNNLHRVLKNPLKVAVLLLLPIAFMNMFIPRDYEVPYKIGVVDQDDTPLTQMLQRQLSLSFELIELESDSLLFAVANNDVDYALSINPGFTASFIDGEAVQLAGFGISGAAAPTLIKNSTNSILGALQALASSAAGDNAVFMEGLASFEEGYMAVEKNHIVSINKDRTIGVLGFLVQFMLYMSVVATSLILEERANKTFHRIFSAPVTIRKYMANHLLSALTIGLLQVGLLFIAFRTVMDVYLGDNPYIMLLLFAVFTVVCIALGLFITAYCRTAKQAYITIMLLTSPLAMLGGCYWPRDWMPDVLVRIGNFLPTTYAIQGAEKLLTAGTLSSIAGELIILLGFATVFFTAGVLRRVDIAR